MQARINIRRMVIFTAMCAIAGVLGAQTAKKPVTEYNQDIVNVEDRSFEFFIKSKDLPADMAERINSNPEAKKLFDQHGLIRVTLDFLHPYIAMKSKFKYDVPRLTPLLPEQEVDEYIPSTAVAEAVKRGSAVY